MEGVELDQEQIYTGARALPMEFSSTPYFSLSGWKVGDPTFVPLARSYA